MNLEDIARLAGVSRSTVSRVVNDDPRVSVAVRERVRSVIETQGYHPNAAARALASRRSGVFGLIIPQAFGSIYNDPWFPVFIQGCVDGCRASDISLMLLMEPSTEPDVVSRLIERFVASRNVDGLIIASSMVDDVLVSRLHDRSFPYMLVGRDEQQRRNFVDIDNRGASATATRHLLSHGRTRPAMIGGPESAVAALDRRQGFLDAVIEAGFDPDTVPISPVAFSQRGAYREALKLLASDVRPDAIFAASDAMAIGVLQAARHLNICVPDDLGVMGFDGIEPDRIAQLELTTIQQPARDLGAVAVARLDDLVHGKVLEPVQVWLDTRLLPRHSCGCPPTTGPPAGLSAGKRGGTAGGASGEAAFTGS
jgi:LacI family transcriptional regulator